MVMKATINYGFLSEKLAVRRWSGTLDPPSCRKRWSTHSMRGCCSHEAVIFNFGPNHLFYLIFKVILNVHFFSCCLLHYHFHVHQIITYNILNMIHIIVEILFMSYTSLVTSLCQYFVSFRLFSSSLCVLYALSCAHLFIFVMF